MQDLTILRRHLPAVTVFVWLAFLAWATWEHIQASGQPLIHDAITYWLKAKNLWASVAHGQWVNPLDVEPTQRPPGTVLMSYPFGFEESPKGFLFRSVFMGIALTALAVFLVACALPRVGTRAWDVACVALFLSALPMHFHFEWSSTSRSPGHWGLTDCFLAGVAALAGAAAILGAVRRSWGWTALAALLSALCFLTKPAGALIVVTVTCAWFVIVLVRGWVARCRCESRVPDWRTLGMGAIVFGAVCGSVLLAGFESRYFSAENLAFGDRVLKVMIRWLTVDSSQLNTMIHTSFGYPFIIAFATAVVAGIDRLRSHVKAPTGEQRALAVGGLLAGFWYLAAGFWFWFIKTGGSQVRYFYPFALMAAISIIPLAFLALHGVSRQTRFVVRAFLLLPPLCVALLLAHPDPPRAWQRLAGVNLAAQPAGPDVALGRRALDALRQNSRGVTLYAVNSDHNVAIESLWLFEDAAHPELPNIRVKRSFDWERLATFLLAGIGEASLILSPYVREPAERKRRLAARSVESYVAEQRLFEAWFSELGPKEGVEVFGETANLRLLRVVDQERFGRALEDLRRSRQWRPEFLAANPHTWWNREELSALLAGRHVAANGVGFDGLFRIEALTLQREGDLARIDFWWSEEKKPSPGEWFFFAHTVDGEGTILGNVPVRLEYRVPHAWERPLRFDSLTVPIAASGAAKTIAFGIFRLESGQVHPLVADSGNRDWDNHRVVVPLP